MRERIKLAGSLLMLLFVILYPINARNAVLEAMSAWAFSFVPALLPVFIVSGALVSAEARRVYEKLLGGISERAFGISGSAFACVCVGLIAGSPAGSSCLKYGSYKKGEMCRAGIMASGLSPAFLSSTVGGLLGWQTVGLKLAVSQALAILSSGWLLRRAWINEDADEVEKSDRGEETLLGAMGRAVVDIAGVLCWMTLFGLAAAVIGLISPKASDAMMPFLEISLGMSRLAASDNPIMVKSMLAAFFCGLGGLCVAFQNAARLKSVPVGRLAMGKLLHAVLMLLYFQTLCGVGFPTGAGIGFSPVPCMTMVLAVFIAGKIIPVKRSCDSYINLKKTY